MVGGELQTPPYNNIFILITASTGVALQKAITHFALDNTILVSLNDTPCRGDGDPVLKSDLNPQNLIQLW